ncbi:MAG TPA: 5'-3' exonuclease H3TH domain-containing protein, partial [Candidatus Berkiella sp.]|nr:5'-3' exonuclease H3TH domain-containing protein [Candidatus Berkiella sp.]
MNIDDNKNKKLVLVDGSSYLFRAYHALPPLTNSKGMPTGAVYGVLNMLRRLMQDEKPDFVAVVFDTKAKNFRHQLYEAYKANRTVMPDELQVQIAPLHKAIRAMGLPLIAVDGYEADDIIGTLALHATKANWHTVISTGDKDMAQLVNESVVLVNTMTSSVLDEKNVLAKFGVAPKQIVDYLTLVGDPVDNVPGIPKVGPKTAAKWLQEYETLDNLVNRAQEIKGKVGEYLRENLSTLPLSKQLVTIVCDVPLDVSLNSLVAGQPETAQLREVFEELEIKSWLKELDKESAGSAKSVEKEIGEIKPKAQYQCVTKTEVFLEWVNLLAKAKYFVIDTETTSLDPMQAELVGIALAINEGQAIYVPLTHDFSEEEQLSRDWVLSQLKPILENPTIGKIGQHLKYDMHIFARYNIFLTKVVHDTMLESYVYNSVATRHDMDSLA